jgi:diguanylate cyclase (GGDEF)-like protein
MQLEWRRTHRLHTGAFEANVNGMSDMKRQAESLSQLTKASMDCLAPAHLSDMLDSLSDGFMSIDRSWRFTYLNHTAGRYLQQKREQLLGLNIWECYPDLIDSDYYRTYTQTAATGLPGHYTGYYAPLRTWFEVRSFAHDDGITVLFRDVTREQEQKEQLEFEASHDYLTGFYNRRKCMEVLSRAVIDASSSSGQSSEALLAVLYIDLDNFKEVNDAFGHTSGDGLLRDFARRLSSMLMPTVFAARVGGDKFVVLLVDTTVGAAEACAQDVLRELAQPFDTSGRSVSLSASIGIAFLKEAPDSAEMLLSRADTAMYAAKSSGRFQIRIYDDALDRGMRERLALRMDLREAFASNQFVLHFQPQIALADDAHYGAEALLRWNHPAHGLLSPYAFLDVLLASPYEETLVDWLVDSVCQQMGAWRLAGVPVPRISLNLSARQLLGPGLVDRILRIAYTHNIAPAMLDIEVTEDSLVGDIDRATLVLGALRNAGISTSLDDFGSGYSSFGYLVRMPIDTLKIDKTFVQALAVSSKASAVIRGIIALARSLGMKTVAEGVETEAQFSELKDAGCDIIQGYLISRPLAPDAFARFLLGSQPA